MNDLIYKSAHIIPLWTLLLICVLLAVILIFFARVDLFIYIFIPISALILFFVSRRFYFFQDRVVISYLYRQDIILLKNVKKIIYQFSGAAKASPLLIIKTIDKNSVLHNIYKFFTYNFVIRDDEKLVVLLRFFIEKGTEINISCNATITKELKEKIYK